MFVRSISVAPGWARVFGHRRRSASRRISELEALLTRIRQRLYPENTPVLASYWLKTVYAAGHKRSWWKELNAELKHVLREEHLDVPTREALVDIQTWIQGTLLRSGRLPEAQPRRLQPFRADLTAERLMPYVTRLLNAWLPAEVASLLTEEGEYRTQQDAGIPVLAVARALERVLIRENLSPGTLEMLLEPGLLSPRYVYPADVEILRDVVLARLGRTWAPVPSVLPATVLAVAAGSRLPADFAAAVCHASFSQYDGGEEIHVPIAAAQAFEILKGDPVRIGSILLAMDGRCWEPEGVQSSGEQHVVVYKPGARPRIDYSADHAKMVVPWPEVESHWPGAFHFRDPIELFGREWHATRWETDGERTMLHLEFSRALTAESSAEAEIRFRRSHPASIDMAWAALESALAAAVSQKSTAPIEQMRHSDLIPLGRAIFALAETVKFHWPPNRELMETQLRAIRYFQTEISLMHGRVPWRILPASIRETLKKRHLDPALLELLNQVFDELPATFHEPVRDGSTSPYRAA
jgi:hypothetical protein